MGTRAWAISATMCALVGAAAALSARALPAEVVPVVEPRDAADLAAADLRAHLAAVEARATTIAQIPRLAAAVATDAATVRDLTAEELAFGARPDETVELGQIRDGAATLLLRLPSDAAATPFGLARPGSMVAIVGERLLVAHVAAIDAAQDGEHVRGSVAVTRTIDGATALPQLARRTSATFVTTSGALAIGGGASDAFVEIDVPLREVAGRLRVPVYTRVKTLVRALYATGVGAGVVAVCFVVILFVRRRPRAPQVPVPVPVSEPVPTPSGSILRGGRYEPLELLGEGGNASVFLARAVGEAGFERRVALKVLRPEVAQHPEARALFLDEARLASRVDHPNVVQILDLGRDSDSDDYFIAMEYVDGVDLETLLERLRADGRALPVALALAIARRVCDGLHAAHMALDLAGVPLALVHRDVKPANILVSRNGQVKVSDFGIAKATQQLHTSAIGMTRGTIALMAPEQRLGSKVDARADVFGAGALVYELATTFALDLDTQRLLARGLDGWPHVASMRALRPELPPELEAVVLRALAYAPAARQASCAELEAELSVVMDAHDWVVTDRELGAWLSAELARS